MNNKQAPNYTDHGMLPLPALTVILLLLVLGCSLLWHLHRSIAAEMQTPFTLTQPESYIVKQGHGLQQVATDLHKEGLLNKPTLFILHVWRIGGESSLQAGEYNILPGDNPDKLLQRILAGDVATYKITFPEGIRFSEALELLRNHPHIVTAQDDTGTPVSAVEIMIRLGQHEYNPEGWFYPDTYNFPSGTSELQILRLANEKMRATLQREWQQRSENLVYDNEYQSLIMASIIESEGVYQDEYPLIAGVFHRRLQRDIALYSDPTVVYAHGEDFKPPLLRRHMKIESPYNTYKYKGFPPTPIALPSTAAIRAALHPTPGDSLYFVSLGNGRHYFSSSLKEHNRKRQELKRAKKKNAGSSS